MKEAICDYCGDSYSLRGIRLHNLHCKDRPKTTEVPEKSGTVQHQEEQPLNPSTSIVDKKNKPSTSVEVLPENIISTEKFAETEKVQNQEESPLNPSTSEVQPDVHEDDESSWGDKVLGVALLGLGLFIGLLYLGYKRATRKAENSEPATERETLSEWQIRQNQRRDNLTAATRMLGLK